MQLFQIDPEKCNKDGICIRECPFLILKANDDQIPEMIPGAEAKCLRCGHCLAVCPTGAVTFDGVSPEDCEPVRGDLPISEAAMTHLIKTRRSIRVYRKRPVPREVIARLLDAVRWADTAKNVQPLHWLLSDDREKIREMARMTIEWMREVKTYPDIVGAWDRGHDVILRDAPLVAIVHTEETGLNPPADSAIAAATLELMATAMGIGSCWAGFLMRGIKNYQPLRAYLNLPEGHVVCAALMLGYPRFTYHRIPPRQAAKMRWL